MKKIELGQAAAILANVGVIVGIAFLAFEVQQSRDMIRAQTRNEVSQGIVNIMMLVAENGELASLRRRADAAEVLTGDEAYRYSLLTRALFRYWENVHYQYRIGVFDEKEFTNQVRAFFNYIKSSTAAVNWWCQFQYEFSDEFAAMINGDLDGHPCQR